MISFFPDLNVWLALSVSGHRHNAEAWNWLNLLPRDRSLIFSRYTQVGLLRLRKAWGVYDRWLADPRVEFYPEPRGLDDGFREATVPFAGKEASGAVGDCYLLAFAKQSHTTLVTFDKALHSLAAKAGHSAVIPG